MGQKHDHDSFIAGAKWMIDKAAAWFRNQKEEIGISWYDDYESERQWRNKLWQH